MSTQLAKITTKFTKNAKNENYLRIFREKNTLYFREFPRPTARMLRLKHC